MSDSPLIYKSLCAISEEVGAIGKENKNYQQNFMFRGIDQVMNVLHPLLVKHGVFIVPEIVESHREERMTKSGGNLIYTIHKVKYHFTANDGSEVVATVVGEGMDSADKSSNKAMAVAFKYACFQVFCIPTEEMAQDDPDGYCPEESVSMQRMDFIAAAIDGCKNNRELSAVAKQYEQEIKGDADLFNRYNQKKGQLAPRSSKQN